MYTLKYILTYIFKYINMYKYTHIYVYLYARTHIYSYIHLFIIHTYVFVRKQMYTSTLCQSSIFPMLLIF